MLPELKPALYPIPKDRLAGRSAEMAFADAVYYATAVNGWKFPERPGAYAVDLNFHHVRDWTGLDVSTINKELDGGMALGWLQRTGMGGQAEEQIYIHDYGPLAAGGSAILKPMAYVEKGWLRAIYRAEKSYLLQRVLNLLWGMPFGAGPRDPNKMLKELCRRAALRNSRPIASSRVLDCLDQLERLGVLFLDDTGYRFNRDRLTEAPDLTPLAAYMAATDLTQNALFNDLLQKNAAQARLASEVLRAGRFDLAELPQIFEDMHYTLDDPSAVIRFAQKRHKDKGPKRWADFWKNFLRRRAQTQPPRNTAVSGSFVARFEQSAECLGLLGMPDVNVKNVAEVLLVAKLQSSWKRRQELKDAPRMQVQVLLRTNDTDVALLEVPLGSEKRQAIRLDVLRQRGALSFTIQVKAPFALSGVSLEAWLDAKIKSGGAR